MKKHRQDSLSPNSNLSSNNGESGQVFFEFILLLLVMITLSYSLLYSVNSGVAKRWQAMVYLVTKYEGSTPPELN